MEMVERQVEHTDTLPRLHLVRDFASDAEMDYIIKEAFPQQRPQDQNTETGMVTELPVSGSLLTGVFDRMRSVIPALAKPISNNSHGMETLRVRRYLPDGIGLKGGDYHPPHTDWFEPEKGDLTNVLIVTMILYLTSPEEGGTTYFRHAQKGKGYHFQPVRGNLAVWWSCYNNGTQDFHSDHSSEPLLKGIKWNAARFFYTDVKNCAAKVEDMIMVPKAANHNKPMASSFDVMFNTTFPPGVSASDKGTRTNETLHGASRYTYAALESADDFEYEESLSDEELLAKYGEALSGDEFSAEYHPDMTDDELLAKYEKHGEHLEEDDDIDMERRNLIAEAQREMQEFAQSGGLGMQDDL